MHSLSTDGTHCVLCGMMYPDMDDECPSIDYDEDDRRYQRERESQTSKHCDAGYMNDVLYGPSED